MGFNSLFFCARRCGVLGQLQNRFSQTHAVKTKEIIQTFWLVAIILAFVGSARAANWQWDAGGRTTLKREMAELKTLVAKLPKTSDRN